MIPYSPIEKKPRWNLKRTIILIAAVWGVICVSMLLIAPSMATLEEEAPTGSTPVTREAYIPEEAEPLAKAWTGPFVGIYKGSSYGKAYLGMSAATVRERCGPPDEVNRTVGSWGIHEQWVYGETIYWHVYLYFKNGYLTSWQE
ncbi:MAG: DUF2845 domain-containing protein [Candidatus Bathyarchaeota archaeon]|nr:DUF2845 domain-containing protein [Candidatus Bathyarchaeota archaeon]